MTDVVDEQHSFGLFCHIGQSISQICGLCRIHHNPHVLLSHATSLNESLPDINQRVHCCWYIGNPRRGIRSRPD